MMQDLYVLAGILAALAIGAVSPGPSFVMVARESVSVSRGNGLAAAFGMGLGGLLMSSAAMLGLTMVLLAVPLLYLVLKVVGGLYLCYLGYRIFRGASAALADAGGGARQAHSASRSFWMAFTTQISNPKTAIVYASVFATFLPGKVSLLLALLVLLGGWMIEVGWYATVALLLSAPAPRRTYLRFKTALDRAAGAVMMALGVRLVSSAIKP